MPTGRLNCFAMSVPMDTVAALLIHVGTKLKDDWLKSCLAKIQDGARRISNVDMLADRVLSEAVGLDLCITSLPALPPTQQIGDTTMKGLKILQLCAWRDVLTPVQSGDDKVTCSNSSRHCWKLVLSDGYSTVPAVEVEPVTELTQSRICYGLKLAIKDAEVRRGCVLLRAFNTRVLGGRIAEVSAASTESTHAVGHPVHSGSGMAMPAQGTALQPTETLVPSNIEAEWQIATSPTAAVISSTRGRDPAQSESPYEDWAYMDELLAHVQEPGPTHSSSSSHASDTRILAVVPQEDGIEHLSASQASLVFDDFDIDALPEDPLPPNVARVRAMLYGADADGSTINIDAAVTGGRWHFSSSTAGFIVSVTDELKNSVEAVLSKALLNKLLGADINELVAHLGAAGGPVNQQEVKQAKKRLGKMEASVNCYSGTIQCVIRKSSAEDDLSYCVNDRVTEITGLPGLQAADAIITLY